MGRSYHKQRTDIIKGDVYFIKVGDRYKIGATTDLYGRIVNLQTANPQKIALMHRVKTNNMYLTEKLFQSLFERDDKRERGEWFNLTDKDIQYIKSGNYSKSIIDSMGVWDNGSRGLQIVGELLTA